MTPETATTPPPKRPDVRHLRTHATRAVGQRLGYAAPHAVRAVERVADVVHVRLNSGGNALAVQTYLTGRGYRAELAGDNPDGCGVRVTA